MNRQCSNRATSRIALLRTHTELSTYRGAYLHTNLRTCRRTSVHTIWPQTDLHLHIPCPLRKQPTPHPSDRRWVLWKIGPGLGRTLELHAAGCEIREVGALESCCDPRRQGMTKQHSSQLASSEILLRITKQQQPLSPNTCHRLSSDLLMELSCTLQLRPGSCFGRSLRFRCDLCEKPPSKGGAPFGSSPVASSSIVRPALVGWRCLARNSGTSRSP